ncbi:MULTISPECIES: toxic anion resistance protein [Pseudomonas]|uniref:toxic anion resistance protein n=1 Tax=Pseudomonas TaxID=286 RepID=UPI0024484147|nr:toxic anion resistance protein [Pseudomonas floridensis]MEE4128908.1 toxic anion resistance protein [Pseudomonas viridiflava]MEE4911793.1 toxic anion resistance protein [Pseudomonas alliivorans]
MQQQTTVTDLATANTELTPAGLQALGLQEQDIPQIKAVAALIQAENPLSVSQFGREVAEHTSSYADSLLDQVRNSDLDDAGAKLSEVVAVAQSLNVSALSDRRSRIPVIGKLIDKVTLRGKSVMGQFDTTREQIEKLVAEVDQTQAGISARNTGLESMFVAVREEHRLLGIHIAAGKQRLAELQAQVSQLRVNMGFGEQWNQKPT